MRIPKSIGIVSILCLLSLMGYSKAFSQSLESAEKISIKGIVISFSPLAQMQIVIGQSSFHTLDDVIIQVTQSSDIWTKGKFVRFRYDNQNGKSPLPEQMFEKRRIWQFELTREVGCDTTLNKAERFDSPTLKYELARTSWASSMSLDSTESVPCFRLVPNGFKKAS
jgi:hypothetical protein